MAPVPLSRMAMAYGTNVEESSTLLLVDGKQWRAGWAVGLCHPASASAYACRGHACDICCQENDATRIQYLTEMLAVEFGARLFNDWFSCEILLRHVRGEPPRFVLYTDQTCWFPGAWNAWRSRSTEAVHPRLRSMLYQLLLLSLQGDVVVRHKKMHPLHANDRPSA